MQSCWFSNLYCNVDFCNTDQKKLKETGLLSKSWTCGEATTNLSNGLCKYIVFYRRQRHFPVALNANAWGKQVETLVSRSKHTDVYNLEGSSKQFLEKKQCPSLGFRGVSLLHPNIRIHFLHNLLHKFPLLLTRRICLTIKSFPHDLNEAFSCITVRKNFKLVT